MRIQSAMVRAAWGAALAASLGVVAAPRAAAADDLPADVVAWFESEAAAVVLQARQGEAATADGASSTDAAEVQLGTPVPLTTWSAEYVAGGQDAPVTTPLDRWAAPISTAGDPVGTVTAARSDDGAVGLAYVDDDLSVARGLLELPAGSAVVYDAPLDAYFTVTGDVVAPMSDSSRSELAAGTDSESFQEQLAARYATDDIVVSGLAEDDPQRAMAGGEVTDPSSAPEEPEVSAAAWLAIAATMTVLAGATALLRRRRASSDA